MGAVNTRWQRTDAPRGADYDARWSSLAACGQNIHGEADLVELLLTGAGRMIGSPDCTPGYYNNEGREPGPAAKLNVGHPAGPMAYFKYIDGWRNSGQFEGLQFR